MGRIISSLLLTMPTTMYRYRLNEEKAEWVIYVTDVGQQQHFDMVFRVCVQSLLSRVIFSSCLLLLMQVLLLIKTN